MPCYSLLHAYEGKVQSNGKIATVWKRRDSPEEVKRDLPCFQCIGCRLERSRQWAMRCMDEASLYDKNCFLTLTYDDDHLPPDMSLNVSEFQNFMKRLRKRFGAGIRYYHAGEYGERTQRPHYHAVIFNHDFDDKILLTVRNGHRLYTSAELQNLWTKGYSSVGDVTFDSAAYVARYVMKKVTGEKSKEFYGDRLPEYSTMSKGCKRLGTGGIGSGWFAKFRNDVFPSDQKVVNGQVFRPPRFYDNLLDRVDSEMLELVKQRRKENAVFNSDQKLQTKEVVKKAQIRSLSRTLEDVYYGH